MIPKIIHYCWFGRGKKPKLAQKCIASWRKYCPDYEIIEWNEDNYDIASAPLYVRQAMDIKKWAFATDYIRSDVVYRYGGIYLDTDVELIKSLDGFLNDQAFFGIERWRDSIHVATGGGFGAEKGTPILSELIELYKSFTLVHPDGSIDLAACPDKEYGFYLSKGFVPEAKEQYIDGYVHLYPPEYFYPLDYGFAMRKTKNTVAIHWYAMSWESKEKKRWHKRSMIKNKLIYYIVGPKLYGKLRAQRSEKRKGGE